MTEFCGFSVFIGSLGDISSYAICLRIHFFDFRSDIDTLQFQMTFEIPRIRVKAQYRSTGVLILVKASGAGDYWGEYGKISFKKYILFFSNF